MSYLALTRQHLYTSNNTRTIDYLEGKFTKLKVYFTRYYINPERICNSVISNTKLFLNRFYFIYAISSQYHKSEEEIKTEYNILTKSKRDFRFFAPLYEKYYDPIFVFINKRIDDEEATADLTAMVFYKCLQKLDKFEFKGVPFSAWLFKIAVNEINLFFRSQKRFSRSVSLQDNHIDILFEEIEYFPGPEKHEIVTQLLSNLSPDDIQFLELRFFENHSFKEMGYLLGLTEVNAKIKTYRILKKLKEHALNLNL